MNKEYIINHFINLYYKSFNDIDLASDDKEYIEHISISETLDIVCSFLNEYDKELYNIFMNVMSFNRESIIFVSNELSNNSSSLNSNSNKITINVRNNIEDVFAIVHEFMHYVDATKAKNKENSIYSETSSITIELFLHKYLSDNKIHLLDSNNYIFNKLKNYFFDAIYVKYYFFKRSISGVELINLLPKGKYQKFIEKEVNELDSPYKNLFLKYYYLFDERIKNDGLMAKHFIKRNYNYLLGLYLGTYLLNKNDKKLISDINKASYSDDVIVPTFDIREVSKSFDSYISKLLKVNSELNLPLKIYNISNFGELMYRIMVNGPTELKYINEPTYYYIPLNDSIDIVGDFFKSYDMQLYNAFVNMMKFDKYSFEFKYNENKYSHDGSCMYIEDGRINLEYCNDMTDIIDLVHEFGHKIDYTYCDYNNLTAVNFTETTPITFELYLYKFLMKNNYCIQDAHMTFYNKVMYLTENAYKCYFIYFLMKTYSVPLFGIQYLDINKNDFISKVSGLPKNIQNILISKFDEYLEIIKSKKDEIYDYLLFNIPYCYAILLAPYLYKINDKELIKDINTTSYLINNHVKGLDETEMDKAFKELINELESVDYSKLVEHIK